jgi:ketosteroid isomerase-like protein
VSASSNRDKILGVYEAFGRGDLDAILEVVSDHVDWGLDPEHPAVALAPWLGSVRTKAEVPSYFAGVVADLEWHAFAPVVVAGDGDDVVAILHEDFTVRATGRRVVTEAVHHFTFGPEGLIVRYRPIVDSRWEAGFRA